MLVYMSDRCQREGAHAVLSSFARLKFRSHVVHVFLFSELKVVFQKMPFHRRNTRFNKKPMNWLFPPETSKYVTILRNLVDNFETVFNFYHLREVFGIEATRTIPWRNSWKNQCHITLSTAADFLRA